MIALSRRVELLLEAQKELRHTEYRTVKNLSIWDQGADPTEPIVVRKARALRLLLDETPAVIMDHELIVGLRTLYGALEETSLNPEALEEEGFEGPWTAHFVHVAQDSIVTPTVEIRGFFKLGSTAPDGR